MPKNSESQYRRVRRLWTTARSRNTVMVRNERQVVSEPDSDLGMERPAMQRIFSDGTKPTVSVVAIESDLGLDRPEVEVFDLPAHAAAPHQTYIRVLVLG